MIVTRFMLFLINKSTRAFGRYKYLFKYIQFYNIEKIIKLKLKRVKILLKTVNYYYYFLKDKKKKKNSTIFSFLFLRKLYK